MKKFILALLMLSVMGQYTAVRAAESDAIRFYVSGSAEQNGDGSLESPFNTLDAAKNAVRELKKNGNYPQNGVTVMVRGGNYFISEGLNLTNEDSGTADAPVTWCVYPGESAKLIGGAEITLGDCTPVTDASVLSRMDPSVSGKVYEIDLGAMGIEGYDELDCTGHATYYTRLYGVTKQRQLPVPEIFYNGEAMPLAQYPNQGEYMTIGKVISTGDNMTEWYESDDPNKPDAPEPGVFTVDDDRIKNWANADQAWVFGYWKHDWSDQTMPVASIDTENKTITPYYQSYYTITAGQRFYIFNLIEELDAPGEWFYDKNTQKLYLYPLDSNPQSSMILSFSSNPVISLNNAENIKIRDFEVTGTRNCGIQISNCKNISISYMSINRLSGEGMTATGTGITIEGCHIYDTGKKGIDISGGDRYTLTSGNNVVFNNHIHDFGRLVKTYEGGIRYTGSVGILIKNNLMYNGSHLAVNPGGNDNIFEYNEIHSVLKEASDMGAIYSDLGMTQRGNIFRYNSIHDCYSNTSQSHKVQAIYFDNSSTGSTAFGNIIYNIGGDGIFINGGRDNTIENNIFANLENSINLTASGRAVSWGWYGAWLDGTRTYGLKGDNIVPYTSELYAKYPHMTNILDDDPSLPKYNVLQNNVSYKVGSEFDIDPLASTGSGVTVEDMYNYSTIIDGIETVKDVGFRNAAENDFALNEDSSVYTDLPDFEPIDADRIGLVTSQLRGLLSNDAIALAIGKPVSYVNWTRKVIDEDNIDVVPFIENDYTYVPVRFLCESLGATVEWEDNKAYIDYNGDALVFTPNSMTADVAGSEVELDAPMLIKNDRIFVPLRAVGEILGKNVFWDDCGLVIVSGSEIESKMNEDRIYDLYNRM